MVQAPLVASAAVSALVLVAIGVALARSRHRHPSLLGQGAAGSRFESTDTGSTVDRLVDNPTTWFAAFLLLTFGAAGAVMAVVVGGQFASVLLYLAVVALSIGLIYGSYAAGYNAGLGSAGSVLVTAALIGLLAVAAVTTLLVTG